MIVISIVKDSHNDNDDDDGDNFDHGGVFGIGGCPVGCYVGCFVFQVDGGDDDRDDVYVYDLTESWKVKLKLKTFRKQLLEVGVGNSKA